MKIILQKSGGGAGYVHRGKRESGQASLASGVPPPASVSISARRGGQAHIRAAEAGRPFSSSQISHEDLRKSARMGRVLSEVLEASTGRLEANTEFVNAHTQVPVNEYCWVPPTENVV